jgi:bifunctional DNA-binding transcriptional regulator/antitoxin component of YhaV-PrlF toxin-antitoxin module
MENSIKRDDEMEDLLSPEMHPRKIMKETKIHEYNGQYSVKLPKSILEEININRGDYLTIEYDTETKEYSIKFKKKRHGKKASPNR